MKSDGGGRLVVDRLHALPGKRAGVLDGLLADTAPARVLGRVIAIRRLAPQHAARTEHLPELWIARIGARLRLLRGIEVIEVAEKLVEALHRREVLVAVIEMVLAELAGGVAERLEQFRTRCVPRLQTDGRGGNADLRQAGAQRALTGDEHRSLGVVVREHHARA